MQKFLTLAVEGATDEIVLRRVLDHAALTPTAVYGRRGKQHLDRRLEGFNRAAEHAPWLVLRDLDRDEGCAPSLVRKLLPVPSRGMLLRVAVRAVEAWLLADCEATADFLGISEALVPRDVESLADPKSKLLALARRSRRRALKEDLLPAAGSIATVGPGYTDRISELVRERWRPEVAAGASDSLRRLLSALEQLRA